MSPISNTNLQILRWSLTYEVRKPKSRNKVIQRRLLDNYIHKVFITHFNYSLKKVRRYLHPSPALLGLCLEAKGTEGRLLKQEQLFCYLFLQKLDKS